MKKDNLPVLAIETTGELCSAAVLLDENRYVESSFNLKHVHSEKLAKCINSILEDLKLNADEIGSVAISAGPGSFTGLRIGFAVGKGIAFGASLPVVAVPTFEALALQISSIMPEGTKFSIANKANLDEVYFGKFEAVEKGFKKVSEIKIIKESAIEEQIDGNEVLFGNNKNGRTKSLSSPSALFVAKWSYFFGNDLLSFDYDFLEPNYIKNFVMREKK